MPPQVIANDPQLGRQKRHHGIPDRVVETERMGKDKRRPLRRAILTPVERGAARIYQPIAHQPALARARLNIVASVFPPEATTITVSPSISSVR